MRNNKGFAITSFLYAILVVFLIFFSLLLVNIINSKLTIDKLKNNANNVVSDKLVENDVISGYKTYQDGTIVYYDILNGISCTDYHEDNSITGYNGVYTGDNKTATTDNQNSCLKFYTFNDDEGDTILNLLLDHNTTAVTYWTNAETAENTNGPIDAINQLKIDTNAWVGTNVPTDYTVTQTGYGNYTIDYDNTDDTLDYKSRLITANEIAEITGADIKEGLMFNERTAIHSFYFDSLTSSASDTCKEGNITSCGYGWLYDRTGTSCKKYGCLNDVTGSNLDNMYGYWTGTSAAHVATYIFSAWTVNCRGLLAPLNLKSHDVGVRPVIEVNKEVFEETKLITINPNGGSYGGTYQNTKITLLEDAEYELETPTKEGYTFIGWYENTDFSGEAVTQIVKGTKENKVFYAKWEEIVEEDSGILATITNLVPNKNDMVTSGNGQLINLGEYGIRYQGTDPNNYVEFNNEAWRIIGIVDGKVKLIRDGSIGDIPWSSNGINNWSEATLQTHLNGNYYNSLTEKNMIDMSTWYLRGHHDSNVTKYEMYEIERNTGTIMYDTPSIERNIGLMYPSDYGFASKVTSTCKDNNLLYDYSSCHATNWIVNTQTSNYEWLITPNSASDGGNAFFTYSSGFVFTGCCIGNSRGVRPVLYLKSNVKITGDGDGSENNKYQLTME